MSFWSDLFGATPQGNYVNSVKQQNALQKQPGNLQDILQSLFMPQFKAAQTRQGPINSAFDSTFMTPGANFGAAKTAAEGYGADLFAPGGQIDANIKRARGGAVQSGFNPTAAEGDTNNILRAGTKAVGTQFAQGATALEGSRMSGLAGAYQGGQQNINDLIESLFTGQANIAQLQQSNFNNSKGFLGTILKGLF